MRVLAVAVLLVGLLGAGCSRPATPEPFGEFSVSRSGGVAGVRDVLRVLPGGVAVVTSPTPKAGRLSADRMAHARRLLESPQLAREARKVRGDDDVRCSDVFVTTVRMGAFTMSVAGTCRTGEGRATPAFDELLDVVADARRGTFDEPLVAGDVPSVTVRVEQPASGSRGPWSAVLTPSGRATLTRPDAPATHRDLPADQRDALALTAGGLLDQGGGPCSTSTAPRVSVVGSDGRRVEGSVCGFGPRTLDAYALAGAIGRVFDLG